MAYRCVSINKTGQGEIELKITEHESRRVEVSGILEIYESGNSLSAVLPVDAAEAMVTAMFELIQEIRSGQVAENIIASIDMNVPAVREGNV
jgi:hypothetical protein